MRTLTQNTSPGTLISVGRRAVLCFQMGTKAQGSNAHVQHESKQHHIESYLCIKKYIIFCMWICKMTKCTECADVPFNGCGSDIQFTIWIQLIQPFSHCMARGGCTFACNVSQIWIKHSHLNRRVGRGGFHLNRSLFRSSGRKAVHISEPSIT